MDAPEIGKLSDAQLVEEVFAEFFDSYYYEGHKLALVYTQLEQLEQARDVLAWNAVKKRWRRAEVAEARGRLRGWLLHRRVQ